jgi:hypothetical protein
MPHHATARIAVYLRRACQCCFTPNYPCCWTSAQISPSPMNSVPTTPKRVVPPMENVDDVASQQSSGHQIQLDKSKTRRLLARAIIPQKAR